MSAGRLALTVVACALGITCGYRLSVYWSVHRHVRVSDVVLVVLTLIACSSLLAWAAEGAQ